MANSDIILSVKVKNALKRANEKYGYDLDFKLRNIVINGNKRGCNGFIVNQDNGSCVYVDTEISCCAPIFGRFMYRYADDCKDYRGYQNHWTGVNASVDDLAKSVIKMLHQTGKESREMRV